MCSDQCPLGEVELQARVKRMSVSRRKLRQHTPRAAATASDLPRCSHRTTQVVWQENLRFGSQFCDGVDRLTRDGWDMYSRSSKFLTPSRFQIASPQ